MSLLRCSSCGTTDAESYGDCGPAGMLCQACALRGLLADDGDAPVPPPLDATDESLADGRIQKRVLVPGTGWDTAEPHFEVQILLTVLVGEEGEAILCIDDEPMAFGVRGDLDGSSASTATTGDGAMPAAVHIGVQTMAKGERARLTCSNTAELGYGSRLPDVPPDARLVFEVTLTDWAVVRDVSPTKDGGALKRVLLEGSGSERPRSLCEVRFRWSARLPPGPGGERPVLCPPRLETRVVGSDPPHDVVAMDSLLRSMRCGEKASALLAAPHAVVVGSDVAPRLPEGVALELELEVVDWIRVEDLTRPRDGGVLKRQCGGGVARDEGGRGGVGGVGQPDDMDRCHVRYAVRAREAEDHRWLQDWSEEGVGGLGGELEGVLVGCGELFLGAELALRSMRPGETALFHCTAEYGFGGRSVVFAEGQEEHPPLSGGSMAGKQLGEGTHLAFKLELVALEKPRTPHELPCAERCERASSLREIGNRFFRAGYFEQARLKYERSLNAVAYPPPSWGEEELDRVRSVRLPCLLNLAACCSRARLRIGEGKKTNNNKKADASSFIPPDHAKAVALCSDALAIDPQNSKALLRRARAHRELRELAAARKDLRALLKHEPMDRAARKELELLRREEERERARRRKAFGGAFA